MSGLIFLLMFWGKLRADVWSTYTNMNQVHDLFLYENQIWAGTSGGVLVLNLADYKTKRFTNADGLGGVNIQSVVMGRNGDLWFADRAGILSRYRPAERRWKVYYNYYYEDWGINQIVYDSNRDELLICSKQGFSIFSAEKGLALHSYTAFGKSQSTDVLSAKIYQDTLYLGLADGLAKIYYVPHLIDLLLQNESWNFNAGLSGVRNIFTINQSLYFSVTDDAFLYGNELITLQNNRVMQGTDTVPQTGLGSGEKLSCVLADGQFYWAGSDIAGLTFYNGAQWQYIPHSGIFGNEIMRVAVEQNSGKIWTSIHNFGIASYDANQWVPYQHWAFKSDDKGILGLWVSEPGQKWVGTWGGGMTELHDCENFNDNCFSIHREYNSSLNGAEDLNIPCIPSFVVVNDIVEDDQNNLWIANYVGCNYFLSVYNYLSGQWQGFSMSNGFPSRFVLSVAVDTLHQKAWVGFEQQGLSVLEYQGTPFNINDDVLKNWSIDSTVAGYSVIPSNKVNDILVDRLGVVWVATANGAARYDYSNWKTLNSIDGLIDNGVNTLAEDSDGNIWMGTNNGVSVFSPTGRLLYNYTVESGLLYGPVMDIDFDFKKGSAWFATLNGLSRLTLLNSLTIKQLEDSVRIFPNPYKIASVNTPALTIDKMSSLYSVSIYTLAGERVAVLAPPPLGGAFQWNGKNRNGEWVAPGIFLVVFNKDSKSFSKKLAVIR